MQSVNEADYIEAIHNVTKFDRKLIEQTIEKAKRIHSPYFPVGTMQWDAWMMYRVLMEYERLQQPKRQA